MGLENTLIPDIDISPQGNIIIVIPFLEKWNNTIQDINSSVDEEGTKRFQSLIQKYANQFAQRAGIIQPGLRWEGIKLKHIVLEGRSGLDFYESGERMDLIGRGYAAHNVTTSQAAFVLITTINKYLYYINLKSNQPT